MSKENRLFWNLAKQTPLLDILRSIVKRDARVTPSSGVRWRRINFFIAFSCRRRKHDRRALLQVSDGRRDEVPGRRLDADRRHARRKAARTATGTEASHKDSFVMASLLPVMPHYMRTSHVSKQHYPKLPLIAYKRHAYPSSPLASQYWTYLVSNGAPPTLENLFMMGLSH